LQARLAAGAPDLAASLQRRAMAWCREHGSIEDAAHYAIAAGEFTALADLLEQHYTRLGRAGRGRTLARWTAALPESTLHRRPGLAIAMAWTGFAAGTPGIRARRLITLATEARSSGDARWHPRLEVLWLLLRALYVSDGLVASITAAAAAAELASDEVPDMIVRSLGALAHLQELAGDDANAERTARAAVEHPSAESKSFGYASASGTLALIEARRGRTATARAHVDVALDFARETGIQESPSGARVSTIDAVVSMREGRLAHAERVAERAMPHTLDSDFAKGWALLVLAEIRIERGRISSARNALAHARELLAATSDAGRLPGLADQLDCAANTVVAALRRPAEALIPAELAVLRLLPDEPTSREIAATLVVSTNTIKAQLRAIYRKLGVNSRADAVARGRALSLIDAEP
jgi:LuxR family transcriptional regulator, maltose regulon positive regulatory protein